MGSKTATEGTFKIRMLARKINLLLSAEPDSVGKAHRGCMIVTPFIKCTAVQQAVEGEQTLSSSCHLTDCPA